MCMLHKMEEAWMKNCLYDAQKGNNNNDYF